MRAIIAVEAMRLRQGKKSTFHVRGRRVDRKKIDRFVQRKRIDRNALDSLPGMQQFANSTHRAASEYASILPESVRCSTPPDDRTALSLYPQVASLPSASSISFQATIASEPHSTLCDSMNTSPETSGRSPPTAPGPYMGLADEVVTILVGLEETPFRIHEGLLCSKSEYFRAAFEGSFKESTEKSVHLRDDDPKVFQFYATWIYTQKLVINSTNGQLKVDICCRLYVLADKLGSEDVQNKAINLIHKSCTAYPSQGIGIDTINYVFDHSLPKSLLWAILVDIAAYELNIELCPELCGAVPEFLFAVLRKTSARLPRRLNDEEAPLDKNRCKTYHVHTNGRSCTSTTPSESTASEHESEAEEMGL
ncbi:MAG: hypothetical protein Q9180_008157 [Flavoplaca navasiana]